MKANYKLKNEPQEAGNLQMSLYDMNKSFMAGQPALTGADLESALNVIEEYVFRDKKNTIHFMLLCKELSYYTIFIKDKNGDETNILTQEIAECLKSLQCEILSIELNKVNGTPEIWIRVIPTGECYCMYFFDYDLGVISFGG